MLIYIHRYYTNGRQLSSLNKKRGREKLFCSSLFHLRGGDKMYITLSELIDLLTLILGVAVAVFGLAMYIFTNIKK